MEMYNQKLTLRDVFKAYCDHNRISVLHVCKRTGIPSTTLAAWVRGERALSARNTNKIRDFLKGKYFIDCEVIVSWLEGDQKKK